MYLFKISRLCDAADSDNLKINSGEFGVLQGTFITSLILSIKLLGQSMLSVCNWLFADCPMTEVV